MQLKQAEQPQDFGQPPGGPDGGAPGDEQEGEPDDGGGGDESDDMAAQNPPQQDDGGQAPAAGPEQGGGAPGGDEQQFGKAEGGGNPNHDPKNGRFTSGAGGGVIFSPRYGGVTLYHGTTPEAKAAIDQQGVMRGPVFFSPSKSAATDYASDGESVVEVNVPADALCVDFDLPGARLLTVDDANEYTGNDWTLDDYIDAGYSVGINESLVVDKAAYEAAGGDAMAKASHGGNPNHDPETGRFTSGSARTPQMRMEKRGLRALYDHTLKNPLAATDSMLVHLTADDLRVAMEKGPAIAGENGEVIVQGKRLKSETGSLRGWGMVKVLWKHGVTSSKPRANQVTLADVLALPEVIRSEPSRKPSEDGGRKHEWRRVRHDGAELVYSVSRFHDDAHSHVVSIHVVDASVMKKSDPNLAEDGCCPKLRIPDGELSVAHPSVGSLTADYAAATDSVNEAHYGPIAKAIGMPPVIRIQLPEVE